MLFLSTPSARRATGCSTTTTPSQTYFYPRPPRGGRLETVKTTITGCYFYPRPPRGGRPLHPAMMVCSLISIHALREEGDATGRHHGTAATDFYPRPPRGGRQTNAAGCPGCSYFYPRPPRGGRHHGAGVKHLRGDNFYPRPPRGGRRLAFRRLAGPAPISIHALREEGDLLHLTSRDSFYSFLSTPSARRATSKLLISILLFSISIHALREEGDCVHR